MSRSIAKFPYQPLITLGEFIKKLENHDVKKLIFPDPYKIFDETVHCLKREYQEEEYIAPISPGLNNDTHLTVQEIDYFLNRLKINGKDIGLDYLRL